MRLLQWLGLTNEQVLMDTVDGPSPIGCAIAAMCLISRHKLLSIFLSEFLLCGGTSVNLGGRCVGDCRV